MINLVVYGIAFYWVFDKLGMFKSGPMQGHDHSLGAENCVACKHQHPELEKRLRKIERDIDEVV